VNAPGGSAFPADFLDFIRALNAHAVEYMLVGGYAVGVYGHVRATTDIDFFYRATSENIARMMRAMTAFGAPSHLIDADHLGAADAVTQMGTPPIRIDLLASLSGVTFEHASPDTTCVEIAGEVLPVIGLAALRQNKMATTRPKDRDDLRHLPEAPGLPASESPNRKRRRT
jgi:hypothetical protein